MGDKVQNRMRFFERGLVGFALGRAFNPRGVPSLKKAPDGRAWTHHVSSPMVSAEVMGRVCDSARREVSPDAWAVAVQQGAPEMGAWLLGLFPGEREGLWREARSAE